MIILYADLFCTDDDEEFDEADDLGLFKIWFFNLVNSEFYVWFDHIVY